MTLWWQEPNINEETAWQFLDECQDFTKNFIRSIPEMNRTKPVHYLYDDHEFNPIGAVIHPTLTVSSRDAMRAITRGLYGTHFIVMAKVMPEKKYELLGQVPSAILAPMSFDKAVPHAGYLSYITWGIDIANIGRLRPWNKKQKLPPLSVEETRDKLFDVSSLSEDEFKRCIFFNRYNRWQKQHCSGQLAVRHGNFAYDYIDNYAMNTLIILLRVLNVISPMQRGLIVPSHCVFSKNDRSLQPYNWSEIRSEVFGFGPITRDLGPTINMQLHRSIELERDHAAEVEISEIVNENNWRADIDKFMLTQFLNGMNFSVLDIRGGECAYDRATNIRFAGIRNQLMKVFVPLNYSTYDEDCLKYSIGLWHFAKKPRALTLNEAYENIYSFARTLPTI